MLIILIVLVWVFFLNLAHVVIGDMDDFARLPVQVQREFLADEIQLIYDHTEFNFRVHSDTSAISLGRTAAGVKIVRPKVSGP
jgi:hypothetical protein